VLSDSSLELALELALKLEACESEASGPLDVWASSLNVATVVLDHSSVLPECVEELSQLDDATTTKSAADENGE
jgi:hypothetical protein